MKTPLYDRHIQLGAKLLPFAGWEMPIQYRGILAEHQAVRERVGVFDVSHMGRIDIRGPNAEKFMDLLSTNKIAGKGEGSATYTTWCSPDGGCIDDTIVYKLEDSHFFIVANAGNRDKDLAHLRHQAKAQKVDVAIEPFFEGAGILALQGPAAPSLLCSLMPEISAMKSMQVRSTAIQGVYVSTTGYTGAGGFELFGPAEAIIDWWDRLLLEGKDYGIEPIGLGARDTLRLEMGFALYGHELTDELAPTESVSAWTVKWDKPWFLGKEALEALEKSQSKRHAYGVVLHDKGIPRQGCSVIREGRKIGEVTSGSFSPTLGKGIALILVHELLAVGNEVDIQVRQSSCRGEVAPLPFLKKLKV